MREGDLLDGRFALEDLAGSGAMGQVFRATDRTSGQAVAIKVLLGGEPHGRARFNRESRMLAELQHPRIVRYIGHGETDSGDAFLAMEWLEGEDLSRCLRRGGLALGEATELAARVAEGLAAAHAQGIVHRDLKPSNLFLVGGRPDQVKILDFGIAQLCGATRLTGTGTALGTPGYMAPEQARSAETLDARADVFSLGCVLFECVTGRAAFTGDHVMALLAKILFEEVPRMSELLPGVPAALDALVAGMLAKNPAKRPRDAAAMVSALAAIGSEPFETTTRPMSARTAALTTSELRLLSVALIGSEPSPGLRPGTTQSTEILAPARGEMHRAVEAHGGTLEILADGSAVGTIVGTTSSATDQAAQAARCALALAALVPGRTIALATGRVEMTGRLPVGAAVDRAAKLLSAQHVISDAAGAIAIDDLTAGLLDARFEVERTSPGTVVLRGERAALLGTRTLLGKPTPCVGRERELSMLQALFEECVEQSTAEAVAVTAPPGVGKSRLGQEFLAKLRSRAEAPAVWVGRGDSLRVGSAFGLLGQALRGTCGVRDGEPIEARREKVRVRVAERVARSEQQRVAEFLGELIGTPFSHEESLPLRAARKDAQLMTEQMRSAFIDFLAAECRAHPVVILLEDLHWGDRSTVQFLDAALRDLAETPVFVLALARPEVHDLFPQLWAQRRRHDMRLPELRRKAIDQLARHVLGDSVGPQTLDRLARLSEGNAFYLEELIRTAAREGSGHLPETVVAMVQSRLGTLSDEDRRVLRAASIFGEAFWWQGVSLLVGSPGRAAFVRERLAELVERELLIKRLDCRFPGDHEYAFRHALVREGAYALLTEEDRVLGHRLAAEWLEQQGEHDALLLAEHFEKGGEGARAGGHYLRAAEQANYGSDSAAGIACTKRALACRIPEELRIRLLGMLCQAYYYNAELMSEALPYVEEVLRVAERGSGPWSHGMMIKLSIQAGNLDELMALTTLLGETTPGPDAAAQWAFPVGAAIYVLDSMGRCRDADNLVSRLSTTIRAVGDREPFALACYHVILGLRLPYAAEDPSGALRHAEACGDLSRRMGHRRLSGAAQIFTGMSRWYLGSLEGVERMLTGVTLPDEELAMGSAWRPFTLAWLLADRGVFDEAQQWAIRLVDAGRSRRLPFDEGRGRWALAEVLRRSGELEAADAEIQAGLALLRMTCPLDMPGALATLAALRLAQGRAAEGLAAAEGGLARYEAMGACGFFRGAFLRLVHAECLFAMESHEAARTAILAARQKLLVNADKIDNPEHKKTFLESVPENARTLELARRWLGEGPAPPIQNSA